MSKALPGVGKSVAIPAGVELCEIVDTVSEHLPGLVRHVAVAAVVDHHVVDDVLDVGLELLQNAILHGLTLAHHLVQVYVSLQEELGPPFLLPEAGEGLPVGRVDHAVLAYRGLPVLGEKKSVEGRRVRRGGGTYTGEVGVLGWRRGGSGQNAPRHLLFQSGHGDLQQHVEVLPLVLVVLRGDGLKGPTKGADKAGRRVDQIWFDAGGVVNPVTVPAQENLSAG